MNLLMEQMECAIDSKIEVEHPYANSYYLNLYCCRRLLKIVPSDLSKDSISFPIEASSQDYHTQVIYF